MVGQGQLLSRLGIEARATALASRLGGDQLENHRAALHRLTSPSEMGTLFKAISAVPTGAPPLAGFTE